MIKTTLPCTCRSGVYMCPEAVALWAKTAEVHQATLTGQATQADYDEAIAAYRAHYERQLESVECGK